MNWHDVNASGLPMTVVRADGQDVEPVETDAFQIAIAETYDVIVRPQGEMPFALVAEALDRSALHGRRVSRRGPDRPQAHGTRGRSAPGRTGGRPDRRVLTYRPLNTGWRFSKKALRASLASSLAKAMRMFETS
jgi:FtsP/CotA-like multicopper oxidase with cupredoxin domain